ncbi:ComEA family DNA-binding protein [soil metagenome]
MSAEPVPHPGRARVRVGAGAALILVLVGLGVAVFLTAITPHGATSVVTPADPTPNATDGSAAAGSGGDAASIYVHILGQVARPGLYELRDGDRAVDVVAAAGGFTDTADPAGLNLARFLTDGEQIVVPAVGEVPVGAPGVTADGKVNLNTADEAALETLPRVGPAMAQRILDWREANGPFTAVEDLLNVTGIGDKTLEGLRELVTV